MIWSKIVKPLFIDTKWSMPFSLSVILFFIVMGGYNIINPKDGISGDTLKISMLLISNYIFVILLTLYVSVLLLKSRRKEDVS